jgi:hypothetical protein
MKPSEFYENLADIVTGVALKPYRDEHLTIIELENIRDRINAYIERQIELKMQ